MAGATMIDLSTLTLVLALIAGIGLGYVLREKKRVDLGKVVFGTIIILIFSMGFSIGSNNELLASMPAIGVNAVVIMALSVVFSIVFLKVARKLVKLE
ncbi:lysine exporter LysO family protein [Candidatus Bathyarchaeota archaeon]|nr:lysine exporter LysO family protein [Candidatus Bathyarchaeota archaeon]